MSKIDRAREVLRKANEIGCVASISGNWVVFKPPLPVDLIIESGDLGEALAKALKEAI